MLTTMLQRNGRNTATGLEIERNGGPRKDFHALLEVKDRTIAELEEQVALLRGELELKNAVLSHIAEGIGELLLPGHASGAADGSRAPVLPARARNGGNRTTDTREEPELPDGYRVVAVASNAWVLVAPRGLRVAGYRGELDLRKAALDAHEHLRRER